MVSPRPDNATTGGEGACNAYKAIRARAHRIGPVGRAALGAADGEDRIVLVGDRGGRVSRRSRAEDARDIYREVNKEGGLLGRKIELVHYDDGSEANKANSFASGLSTTTKSMSSSVGQRRAARLAAIPVIDKAGTPFIRWRPVCRSSSRPRSGYQGEHRTDRMAASCVRRCRKRDLTKGGADFGDGRLRPVRHKETLAVREVCIEMSPINLRPKDTDVSRPTHRIKGDPNGQALSFSGRPRPAVVPRTSRELGIKLPV